jgi:hypothetical protein
MAIGLFFPLGLIPLQQASNIWFLANFICLLSIVWISSGSRRPPILLLVIGTTVGGLFPSSIEHLRLGQITLLITLAFLLVALWEDRIPALLSAFLIAVGLSKPQLAVLVLPGLMFHMVRKYGPKRAFQFTALVVASILILTIPLFLAFPNWLPDLALELQSNPSWAQPSSLYVLRIVVPGYGEFAWIVLAIVLSGINIRLWMKKPRQEAILWSLALTPLMTPYVWTWDFVMMLPLFINSLFRVKSKVSLSVLLVGYIAAWLVVAGMKLHGQVSDDCYWWMPWYLVATVLFGGYVEEAIQSRS